MKKIKKCETSSNPELNLPSQKSAVMGDMTIAEVAAHYPETMPVFFKHGMTCFGCPMALMETVAQGAEAHGMDVEELVKALNGAIRKRK